MASMIVGTPKASAPTPTVALACMPRIREDLVDDVAEPVGDPGQRGSLQVGCGVDVDRRAQPGEAVEVADGARQRRDDGQRALSRAEA